MTRLRWYDGKPLMNDGKVAGSELCCCGCQPRFVCYEIVHDFTTATLAQVFNDPVGLLEDIPAIPAQGADVFFVGGMKIVMGNYANHQVQCATDISGLQWNAFGRFNGYGCGWTGGEEGPDDNDPLQFQIDYERWKFVDSCDDCNSEPTLDPGNCYSGVESVWCKTIGEYLAQTPLALSCIEALGISMCAGNPLP